MVLGARRRADTRGGTPGSKPDTGQLLSHRYLRPPLLGLFRLFAHRHLRTLCWAVLDSVAPIPPPPVVPVRVNRQFTPRRIDRRVSSSPTSQPHQRVPRRCHDHPDFDPLTRPPDHGHGSPESPPHPTPQRPPGATTNSTRPPSSTRPACHSPMSQPGTASTRRPSDLVLCP